MSILKSRKIILSLLLLFALATQAEWRTFWHKIISAPLETPNFEQIKDSQQRKTIFFNYLEPIIEQENNKILLIRNLLKNDKFSPIQLKKLAKKYRLKNPDKHALLRVIDMVPTSLVLAQAAIESNWGRSRFARRGHNYFGIWCFRSGCGIVPKKRHKDATHEVATFSSIAKSVEYYLLNINRNSAYLTLRKIRSHKRDNREPITGYGLAEGLDNYAQIGYEYVETVQAVIRQNQLQRYDALVQ